MNKIFVVIIVSLIVFSGANAAEFELEKGISQYKWG
jgi:hypothetical protein